VNVPYGPNAPNGPPTRGLVPWEAMSVGVVATTLGATRHALPRYKVAGGEGG